ncbi:satratoxin biosynthesis SC1 cluster protein 4 [Colletotrichum spaethianum]|uniref:Satratoxin biosynthesis SC1 cluster protein 4 n=1 Tax=Colletotrichum spaethianum TaxID=700344 RepID=A0AA37P6L1_9PEZI|nr:satratoxin biosynthesis SC1 cluster protein 4 [Colletotrichum spaethianum]GKT46701.1 satratoxin biosynthesis SC1 cluster protein 4 [Colletotrichum spaethianum]
MVISRELFARLAIPSNGTVRPEDVIQTEIVPLADRAIPIIVANVLLTVVTTLWTGMRLYSRRKKGQSFTVEDILTVVALAAYGVQTLFAICLGFIKIGITLMLQRVFFVRTFKIAARITTGLCVCWMLFTILIGIFICQPVAMNWNPATPGGKCGDQNAAFAAVGYFDLATDLIILILPVPMVYKLHLRWPYKVALYFIFGAGALTMVFGALRLKNVLTMDFTDVTYSQVGVVFMGTLEPGVAIIVSSSPLLKPVFDATIGRFWSLRGSTAKSTTGGGAAKPTTLQTIGQSGLLGSKLSRAAGGGGGGRFSQMHSTHSDEDLELDRLREKRHNVAVVVAQGNQSEESMVRDFKAKGDDASGSDVGILVTNRTSVISEERGKAL